MKTKVEEAVLNHTITSVAVLSGGASGQAVVYAPDTGALYYAAKELRPIDPAHSHKIENLWKELQKSTDMGFLVVRCDGNLSSIKKALRLYREAKAA